MLSRRAVVAALCVTALCGPASADTPPVEVLRLGGQSGPVAGTVAVTDPHVSYAVTVSGVISYNRRLSMMDCGHWDPSNESRWRGTRYPLLDGVMSPCSTMPVHASHTYCWTQAGTGRRLVFEMTGSAADAADDVGSLVIVVERLTPGAPVQPGCRPL